jgi:phage tail sheath protein FI
VKISAKPIEGVSTSTAGMIGVTQKGPLNKPTLITSFVQFRKVFGGYLDSSYSKYRYLPHSVEGFFQNGGKRVYITRVAVKDNPEPSLRTGLNALKNINEISVVAIPGITDQEVQDSMITHCELMMDRFAVLDPIENVDLEGIQEQRSLYDSKYAGLYYPWVNVNDPYSEGVLPVPPSGHICGIYARSDTERGVHKAPANEVLRGVLSIERNINTSQQEMLNLLGVNCLRVFEGRGIRVWGARTISDNTLWKYVSVRRLFIYLEESIKEGTKWVVFEPNDGKLWTRLKQKIAQFLIGVWKDGALMGLTPEEAFFVKCDRTTMTQDDIEDGRLILLVGVAPVKPAEFVIFHITQWTGGSEVSE